MPAIVVERINLGASICSIVGFVLSGRQFLYTLASPSPNSTRLLGHERLLTVLLLGLLVALGYGVLWSFAERIFNWHYGAGGWDELPKGWSAVALSLSMTTPLILVPLMYQRFSSSQVVAPRHLEAGIAVTILSALAHLLIYGWKRFDGVRSTIIPSSTDVGFWQAMLMEVVHSLAHFCPIVLVYRIIVDSQFGPLSISVLATTGLSALVFLFGIVFFVVLRFPDSLRDKTWIQVRGLVAGLLLGVTLTGGMLM